MSRDALTRPERFSADEWDARVQLAAAYRIFDHLGWSELIYNHLSLRVPGEAAHFLVNPFGLHYSEVTASNLVTVDVDGNILGHSEWPINPAGFTFHGAIHATLPDAHCVMHVHTTPTMAVCCLEDGLSFTNFYAAQLWGKVAYHDFEGITVHAEEGTRILRSAQGKPVLLAQSRAGGDRPDIGAGICLHVGGATRLRGADGDARQGRAAADSGAGARSLRA
jgi:ribulose-5-phosphate 4-epimerase/fuculose-1-phosphate aldolase